MVDLELMGTSRRSPGGRPHTFEHRQLLRLDNSQVICQNVLHSNEIVLSAQTYVKFFFYVTGIQT